MITGFYIAFAHVLFFAALDWILPRTGDSHGMDV
jgi:hypothetical protein